MSQILEIRLLGGFSLTYDDRPVAGITTARSQALFAYLVLHHQTPQPRQRLAFYLWTDSTDTQARTNLRKELSYLRRDLPDVDRFLLVEAKTLQWLPNAPFTLDVREFEQATKTAAQTPDPNQARSLLEQALQLYAGDLLPSCEDEWIIPERERLQQIRVRAVEQLIDLLREQQDYRTAIGYAQQLLRIDPLNEATYTSLMHLHHLNGDRANALQLYHRCMTLLREELGVDPGPTIRKLYEQLLRADELPKIEPVIQSRRPRPLSAPDPALSPLIGREREWDIIQQWIGGLVNPPQQGMTHGAPAGAPEVLLLLGEPGIGKTRLLEELRQRIQAEQQTERQIGQVLWGRAFAAEMVRPYGVWIDALRSQVLPASITPAAELGVLLPEIGLPEIGLPKIGLPKIGLPETRQQPPMLPDRSHLFDAVVQLLAAWADRSPLVVIFDDIQWIDEASSALFHYAIRLLNHLPLQFACTARAAELKGNSGVSQVLQTLRRERRLKTLELSPLDRGQTLALVRNFKPVEAANLPVEVADQIFIDSGGNPLFALEVARGLSHHPSPPGNDLEALIGDRLQQLDENVRAVLPWAAALGRSFKPTIVAQVADYPLPQLLTAIDQLEHQAVIRPSTSIGNEVGYDFAHDIVRQVVYRQLSGPRRHLVHLQIAHRLNQLSTPDNALAGDIARHASLGGDHELAASMALLAAERCLKLFAYGEAATLAQQGIQHCQQLDQRTRIRLQLGLLRVRAIAGVTGDPAAQLEADVNQLMAEANRLGLRDEEAIGLEAVGVLYFNQSNFTNVHQHSLRAVEVSRKASPATAARLLAYSGSCLAEIGRDMVRAEALLLEAQSLAARVDLALCDIYSGLGSVHLHNGDYAEARPLLQQAWQFSQAEQDHWRECTYLSYLAMLELEVGNPAAALPYCGEMAIVAAKIQSEGSEAAVATALQALANYQLQQPGSDAALEQAIVRLHQVDAKRLLSYLLIGAAAVDLRCQRLELAAVRAEAALETAQTMQHPSETALAWAILIRSSLAMGATERAMALFDALWHQIDRRSLSVRAQSAVDQIIQQIQGTLA